jgi:hypothetical protein
MTTSAQNHMTVQQRPLLEAIITLSIAPGLAILALLCAWAGSVIGVIAFTIVAIQAFAGLNARADSGSPLRQEDLERILEEAATAVRTNLYARDDNPLKNGGTLEITIDRVNRYRIPSVTGAVRIPGQSRWVGVSPIVKEAFYKNISGFKIAATARWLTNTRHTVRLDPPTSHEFIEAIARRKSGDTTEAIHATTPAHQGMLT